MRNISIRERLILYFVLLSVISIAVVSLFSIFQARKGITDRTFSQLALLRDIRREQINAFYESRGSELTALSASGTFHPKDNLAPESGTFSSDPLFRLVTDTAHCRALFFITTPLNGLQIRYDSIHSPQQILNLDSSNIQVLSHWSDSSGPQPGNMQIGGGAAVADIDKNGSQDLLLLAIDNPNGTD